MKNKKNNWLHRMLISIKLFTIEYQTQLILLLGAIIIIIILLLTS